MRHPLADNVDRADRVLHEALQPGDELRGLPEGLHEYAAETFPKVMQLLFDADNVLDTGVGGGEPDAAAGLEKIREAHRLLESMSAVRDSFSPALKDAWARALRSLDV